MKILHTEQLQRPKRKGNMYIVVTTSDIFAKIHRILLEKIDILVIPSKIEGNWGDKRHILLTDISNIVCYGIEIHSENCNC